MPDRFYSWLAWSLFSLMLITLTARLLFWPPGAGFFLAPASIAALFNPLRRRIQPFIDRLLHHKKYDAAKALEGFSLKLRDEMNLERIAEEMVLAIHDTRRLNYVGLWRLPKVRT